MSRLSGLASLIPRYDMRVIHPADESALYSSHMVGLRWTDQEVCKKCVVTGSSGFLVSPFQENDDFIPRRVIVVVVGLKLVVRTDVPDTQLAIGRIENRSAVNSLARLDRFRGGGECEDQCSNR